VTDVNKDAQSVDYDPLSAQVLNDPFTAYQELRQRCPVHYYPSFGERGFFTLTRHGDVVDLFKDTSRWSADWGQAPLYVKEGGLKSDPPEHTIYRKLVTTAFTGRRVAAMESAIEQTANRLIDDFVEQGHADLCAAFAIPLPVTIIAEILGVPADKGPEFKEWCDEFMAGQNAADPDVQGRARARIDAFFVHELARRRQMLATVDPGVNPVGTALPDDVLTALLVATHDGQPFTDEQLLPLLLLLLVGGNETTTSLIGNLVARLLELGLWQQVVADPGLWDVAIEESLRYDPPVLGLYRTARGDQEVHGVAIPADAKVQGVYASANRDPAVWDDADHFRLDRDLEDLRRDQLSFGVGIWFCPGASLARLETRIAIRLLGQRLPNLRLDGSPERVDPFMMWGPKRLPVAWDPPGRGGPVPA
jgi:cytochrome P450